MDYKVRTADGQSEGLQVLGVGKPWPIYLEGIQPCKTKLFQSEVRRTQDQQRQSFDDPRLRTEDQRLASTKEWQGGCYIPGFPGYYCTFIPQYSVLSNWLNRIKKAEKFL